MEAAIEKSAMRKIYMRLLPFAIFTYFLAYIDRINVSFAGLTMRGDLDMSATAFGFAAGTFYWGYFLFEVPSNVDHGKGRRAAVDRAHHDHLGHLRRPDRHGHRRHQLLRRALPAGRRRSRLLPGHRALLHLLVPGPPPCAHRLGLPDRPADRGGRRRADLHRAARPRRRVGPARLADGCISPRPSRPS